MRPRRPGTGDHGTADPAAMLPAAEDPAVADPAAAQERTTLAWRRTGLALVVGALTIGRLTLDDLGAVVVVPTAVAAALATWVLLRSSRARRRSSADAGGPSFSVLADGRLPGVVAVVVGALAVGELVAALVPLR